ncbi:MAG: methylated-DNA--[protein]-cysteine S-methyltransferase [Bacillota bacterium]
MTKVEEIIQFLETDSASVTFTERGLKYLSLRTRRGEESINLSPADEKRELSSREQLFVDETFNFLKTGKHSMPLDLTDFTSFQQSVFEAVSKIEPGRVVTYKDVAIMLGKPGGAQAVGNAIAKNPVSYFLPTHRVLPQKGIGICKSGAGHLREKFLVHEGHDLSRLRGNYICPRKKCCLE